MNATNYDPAIEAQSALQGKARPARVGMRCLWSRRLQLGSCECRSTKVTSESLDWRLTPHRDKLQRSSSVDVSSYVTSTESLSLRRLTRCKRWRYPLGLMTNIIQRMNNHRPFINPLQGTAHLSAAERLSFGRAWASTCGNFSMELRYPHVSMLLKLS